MAGRGWGDGRGIHPWQWGCGEGMPCLACQRHVSTARGQAQRDLGAHAAGCARHKSSLAVQVEELAKQALLLIHLQWLAQWRR